jgi:hypothetical protein
MLDLTIEEYINISQHAPVTKNIAETIAHLMVFLFAAATTASFQLVL